METNLSQIFGFSRGNFRFSVHNVHVDVTTEAEPVVGKGADALLAPYVPRLVRAWSTDHEGARVRAIDGSLVSVDISGFTALAERLSAKGKAGAEELVRRISGCFDRLIEAAEGHGGDVLKFRGDALLLFFVGDRHSARAAGAASDMQWTIEAIESADVELRMSAGVHSGECHFFLTEAPHRELLVAGPGATRVFELEDLASAGEIVLSAETAAAVDPAWLDEEREGARLMRRLEPGASTIPPPPDVPGANLDEYVPAPLRAHLAVSSGEAEHRQVTVAFVKLSQTDEVIGAAGPAVLAEKLDALAASVDRACATYGITWLESDIDVNAVKLYLTGGAPSSSGQDEEGMLRALRDIVATDVGLPLRAGVNRGHVFTGDIGGASRRTYAVMGDAVNLAARLTARAQPGDILATGDVLDRARTMYATEKEPLLVKGKERAVTAHHVGDVVGTREDAQVDTAPIVGREREVELLQAAVNSARMRQLQVVELVGEPGIGKSRLVQELRTLALGFTQLNAAGERYASSTPFHAWRNLLRQLAGITPESTPEQAGAQLAPFVSGVMPDLAPWLPLLAIPFDAEVLPTPEADALDPAASREKLLETVETFLERILMMPTLLVVEDAHWLDDSSRSLLRELTQGGAARPWLVCVTTRPGVESSVHLDGPVQRVELLPLEADRAAALALSLADEVALSSETLAALTERSGGNPLFVRELVTAARAGDRLETLPESVESLLTTRIDTLEPEHRMLLRYAAVVGPTFELDFVGEIFAEDIPDAGDPARWEWLREFVAYAGDMTYAFRHDLVRATAYEGLSFQRRRDIHCRVAAALEKRGDEAASLLSLHFFEAGVYERAWTYAVQAGEQAHATFANVDAAELYERAIAAADNLPEIPAPEVARVEESLGDVCERFGAYDRAFAALERARELVGADSALLDARLLGKQSLLHELMGRYGEALDTCDRALARLDETHEEDDSERDAVRATIELGAGAIHYRQTNNEKAIRWLEAAVEHSDRAGDRSTLAHAYYLLDAAHSDFGSPDGLKYLELARPIYEELGDVRGLGVVLSNLGIHAYYEGRWDESLAYYRESRDAKVRAGDVIGAVIQLNNEAEILSDQGHADDAEPLFEEMLRVSRASGWAFGEAAALSNLGRAAARSGRFDEAHPFFDQALAIFEELSAERFIVEAKARRTECLVFEGRYQEALDVAGECREAAAKAPVGGVEALIERSIGYSLHQARRPEEGKPHFEESLRIARHLKVQYEVALTLRALAATGDPRAGDLAAESEEILRLLGVVSLPTVPLP
jgi:class 3 adenylate cyclase/tetratricopeptide (TPR) repeat protein